MGGVTLCYLRSEPICEVGKTRMTQRSRACFHFILVYKRMIIITSSKADRLKPCSSGLNMFIYIFSPMSQAALPPLLLLHPLPPQPHTLLSGPSQQWVVDSAKESKAKP